MHRRLRRALLTPALTGLLLTTGLTPADADGTTGTTVQITTQDVTLPASGGCLTSRLVFDVPGVLDGSVARWTADVAIQGPDGTNYDSDYESSSNSNEYYDIVSLCDYDATGTYTVHVDWETLDAGDTRTGTGATDGSFVFTITPMGRTQVALTRTHRGAHGWNIKARLFRDGRSYANRRLDLQVRIYGSWYSLELVKRSNNRGVATWTAMPTKTLPNKIRVHFDGNATTEASNSRVFFLPRR